VYPINLGLVIGTKTLWAEVQDALKDQQVQVTLQQTTIDNLAEFLEALQRLGAEMLILDVSTHDYESVIRSVRSLSRPPLVIAVHTVADPLAIVTAMKAGANEFLYSPLQSGLRQGIQTAVRERNASTVARAGGKVIAALSAKGGCGATTIACHLAVNLQRHTKDNVLLADFDMDAGLIGFLMKSKSPYTFVDAVKNVGRLDLSFWHALLSNGLPGVEVLSAPTTVAGRELVGMSELRHVMRFMRAHYGWTVVDLGRGLNPLSLGALEEVDEALLITTLEVPTLHQTKHLIETILNMGFRRDRLRVILNRSPKESELTPGELDRLLGVPLYKILPDEYTTLYEAYSDRKLAGTETKIGKHFADLAMKIAGLPEEKPKRKFSLFG
jgi:pilus assembly protein CpaE